MRHYGNEGPVIAWAFGSVLAIGLTLAWLIVADRRDLREFTHQCDPACYPFAPEYRRDWKPRGCFCSTTTLRKAPNANQ